MQEQNDDKIVCSIEVSPVSVLKTWDLSAYPLTYYARWIQDSRKVTWHNTNNVTIQEED